MLDRQCCSADIRIGDDDSQAGEGAIDKDQFDQDHTVILGSGPGGGRLLKPGDLVGGSYRLKTLIGRGGMSYVFCAEHTIFKHDYALKVLAPEQLNEISWKRFESEGRAIAALDHVNIVKVYNMGIDGGDCPFYVMDLLDGSALGALIKSGQSMDFDQVLDVYMQIANGLAYAHSKGIIHRDVKPSNVMLLPGERGRFQVKLVDFGLAKLLKGVDSTDQRLTAAGQTFGTPNYMSPEQCMGLDVDNRADIYSLGCSLFETVKGRKPFRGPTPLATVLMHLNEPVPGCADACPDRQTGQSMDILIHRMMAKKARDRYPSMLDVEHDLQRIKERKEIGRPTTLVSATAKLPEMPPADLDQGASVKGWPGARPIGGLVAVSVLAVVLLGFAMYAGLQVSKPTSPIHHSSARASQDDRSNNFSHSNDSGQSFLDTTAPSENFIAKDARLAKSGKVLSEVTKIDATISGGYKVIHFPAYSIGEFATRGRLPAKALGNVAVPIDAPVELYVDWNEDSSTLFSIDIFDKIDPGVFSLLSLEGLADVSTVASRIKKADLALAVKQVLTAASKWTKLEELRLHQCESVWGDDTALDILDNYQHLTVFVARGEQFRPSQLAEHKFLLRLTSLDLNRSRGINPLLTALADSRALETLMIDETDPSAKSLAQLAKCPKLRELDVQRCDLGYPHMEKISQLPYLRTIRLKQLPAHALEQDLKILSQSKSLTCIWLNSKGVPQGDLTHLLQAFPKLKIDDKYN